MWRMERMSIDTFIVHLILLIEQYLILIENFFFILTLKNFFE